MSSPEPNEERSRDRSPQFPFIPLGKAVERARELEIHYKRSPGRIVNVLPIWGFSPKSSGGLQTIAALKSFGLLDDEGSGSDRKVRLTDLAYRILKDERPGKREEAIREAALKPKQFAEHWATWGAARPPDLECISELQLDKGYTDDAAARFLKVYDDTVAYAQLSAPDNISDKQDDSSGNPAPVGSQGSTFRESEKPPATATQQGKVMPERLVFAQEIDAPQAIKLLVTGPVDDAVLDALDDFVQFQRIRLQRSKAAAAKASEVGSQSTSASEEEGS